MSEQRKFQLRPCPFCGRENIRCEVLDDGWKFVEVCSTCKARGPVYRTMPESLRGWNTRVEAEVEALLAQAYQQLAYLWKQNHSCPCGARRLDPAYPHVSGCPTGAALMEDDGSKSHIQDKERQAI